MDTNTLSRIDRLDRIARRMDSAFRIPGTKIRIGADGILGLVPGIGDGLALAPAAYIIWESHRIGAPPELLARMAVNVGVDALVGTVPLIGDIFDIGWKANLRNADLLRRHFERQSETASAPVSKGRPSSRSPAPVTPVAASSQPTSSRPEKK